MPTTSIDPVGARTFLPATASNPTTITQKYQVRPAENPAQPPRALPRSRRTSKSTSDWRRPSRPACITRTISAPHAHGSECRRPVARINHTRPRRNASTDGAADSDHVELTLRQSWRNLAVAMAPAFRSVGTRRVAGPRAPPSRSPWSTIPATTSRRVDRAVGSWHIGVRRFSEMLMPHARPSAA